MMLAATLMLAALAAAPSPDAPPITLIVGRQGALLHFDVVGLARAPYSARYTLEVIGQGPGGTNRTTQAGQTMLRPGVTTKLLSVALGTGGGHWTAVLTVTPAEGAPYRQQRSSEARPGA